MRNDSGSMTRKAARVVAAAVTAAVLSFSIVGCSMIKELQNPSTASSGQSSGANGDESSSGPHSAPPSNSGSATEAEKHAALEAFVELERSELSTIKEQTGGLFTDITFEAEFPDTIVITYTYAHRLDPDVASGLFEAQIPTLKKVTESQMFPAMDIAGIKGSKHVTYVYLNPDGSLIWQKDFAGE